MTAGIESAIMGPGQGSAIPTYAGAFSPTIAIRLMLKGGPLQEETVRLLHDHTNAWG